MPRNQEEEKRVGKEVTAALKAFHQHIRNANAPSVFSNKPECDKTQCENKPGCCCSFSISKKPIARPAIQTIQRVQQLMYLVTGETSLWFRISTRGLACPHIATAAWQTHSKIAGLSIQKKKNLACLLVGFENKFLSTVVEEKTCTQSPVKKAT